ncbi:MAG: peptidoglycan DD-metalloendopeptidase family protein, partial [Gammaproteobacteria bacterium]|nr:peptidoglycan DD-metalloendopeptidase family protein [Gammaproteobacteria bacterium]
KLKALKELQQTKRASQSELIGEQKNLARQIRAAYMIGQHDFLKLLLNQKDPSALGRTLVYYEYHSRASADRIALAKDTLNTLTSIEEGIKRETDALQKLRSEQLHNIDRVKAHQVARKQLIARLHDELDRHGEEVTRLRTDERRLEALVKSLGEVEQTLGELPDTVEPFASLKGKLAWPVDGKVVTHFGSPTQDAMLTRQGVFIRASSGEELRAINHGRVVYAEWFRNLGLLIIVDHGEGYMSIYGHNQSLYKSVGDWVEAGEVIASVGNTGGQSESGLYFEIRHDGEPQNPALWCRRSRLSQ